MTRTHVIEARWLIVAAVAVCVLGVLILPQVDLPDFTLNSTAAQALSLDHGSPDAFSSADTNAILINRSPHLDGFGSLKQSARLSRTNVTLELTKTSAIRC